MNEAPNLYGLPGAESLQNDPVTVYRNWAWDFGFDDPVNLLPHELPMRLLIEEWSAIPLSSHFPDFSDFSEWFVGQTCSEFGMEDAEEAVSDSLNDGGDVSRLFEALLDVARQKISPSGYRMAEIKLRDLIVTWDTEGNPVLDGAPIPMKRQEIPGQEVMFE